MTKERARLRKERRRAVREGEKLVPTWGPPLLYFLWMFGFMLVARVIIEGDEFGAKDILIAALLGGIMATLRWYFPKAFKS